MAGSRKSRRRFGWSVLCTTTWGSLITRQVASSVPQTRSVPDCYPCLRKKMGTDRPVRTQTFLARPDGFEPPTTWLISVISTSYGRHIVLLNAELRPNKCLILLNAIGINSTRIYSYGGPPT